MKELIKEYQKQIEILKKRMAELKEKIKPENTLEDNKSYEKRIDTLYTEIYDLMFSLSSMVKYSGSDN